MLCIVCQMRIDNVTFDWSQINGRHKMWISVDDDVKKVDGMKYLFFFKPTCSFFNGHYNLQQQKKNNYDDLKFKVVFFYRRKIKWNSQELKENTTMCMLNCMFFELFVSVKWWIWLVFEFMPHSHLYRLNNIQLNMMVCIVYKMFGFLAATNNGNKQELKPIL